MYTFQKVKIGSRAAQLIIHDDEEKILALTVLAVEGNEQEQALKQLVDMANKGLLADAREKIGYMAEVPDLMPEELGAEYNSVFGS